MTTTVVDIKALPDLLLGLISAKKVRVSEVDGVVQVEPVKEQIDCTIGLRGILADCDDMSVDKFLERMRADKELDL